MNQAIARAPRKQLLFSNIKWVFAFYLRLEFPSNTLCQVNPCDDTLDHLIPETCKSTAIGKNLLLFHNDVSDQHNIHVMILEGDQMTYTTYLTSDCSGTSTATNVPVGVCAQLDLDNVRFDYSNYTPTSSSKSSADKLKACFAGSETLYMESGDVKAISDVRVGDRVLSADAGGRIS